MEDKLFKSKSQVKKKISRYTNRKERQLKVNLLAFQP